MSFECCLEHAENLEQCAVPCSSQNNLYALGLHRYQSLKGRLKGCPTPPEWEGQRKGKRNPLETSSKDNPWPEEPVLTLLAVTLIDTAKPLCTSCSPLHCHHHYRALEPLLVPSGSLSAPGCLHLIIVQISYDGETRKQESPFSFRCRGICPWIDWDVVQNRRIFTASQHSGCLPEM